VVVVYIFVGVGLVEFRIVSYFVCVVVVDFQDGVLLHLLLAPKISDLHLVLVSKCDMLVLV
jgi:hypothetical protein